MKSMLTEGRRKRRGRKSEVAEHRRTKNHENEESDKNQENDKNDDAPALADVLQKLVLRAVAGDEAAIQECLQRLEAPTERRAIAQGLLVAARVAHGHVQELKEKLVRHILPAMFRGIWSDGDTRYLDIEVGTQRLYCAEGFDEETFSSLGIGDEIAVATVEQGPPVFVKPLGRPFEVTGNLGQIVETRETPGGYELQVEAKGETFTCLASARFAAAIDDGEIEARGGLPVSAVYARGIVWKLFEERGRAEQAARPSKKVTLSGFAGYSRLRTQVTQAVALHVLSLEPSVLCELADVPPSYLSPPFRGVLSTGLPGTGKTFLTLAVLGSLEDMIGAPKARAKRAAIRLRAALRPGEPLFEAAGRPDVEEAHAELREALHDQYRGFREFGLEIGNPKLPPHDVPELAEVVERLLEGYRLPEVKLTQKLHDLTRLLEARKSDFMTLTLSKEHYIRPYVGEGLNALAAQLRRAVDHDDVAILCLPEAEVLLASRGHQARYYTDELVGKFLEVLDGTEDSSNLFLLADGNRVDMLDNALGGRRLEHVRFPGLGHDDRPAVIASILSRSGTQEADVEVLAQKLLDLIYSGTTPLCELVMVDGSTIPFTVDHILTPAVIQNAVRVAARTSLAGGRRATSEEDLEDAWKRELEGQAERFDEETIISILDLDRKTAGRVNHLRRNGA